MKHEFRMIKIRIGFILFLIVPDTNAGLMDTVSKEVTKMMKPRDRSTRVLPLQKDLEKDEDIKTEEEFEIALATERLGFVYCDVKQEPFMGRFVREYLKISQGHSAILHTLVPRKVTPAEMPRVIKACNNYLAEEVLRDNGLRFAVVDDDFRLDPAVERVIQFDYFSAKPYKFAALQCPVRMVNQLDTKIKSIFFSALGKTDDEREKNDKEDENVDGIGRPYYVFADYTQLDKSKFKILMRTVQQDPRKIVTMNSPARDETMNSRVIDNPQRCPIRLDVRPERLKDGFRLFGKDAEAAFLTEMLRFFNKSYDQKKINRFIDTQLEMKKGYEILSYNEWISELISDYSRDLSVSGSLVFDCVKYVRGAKSLQKYHPIFQADDKRNPVSKVSLKIGLKISGKSLERVFYQCPVTFTSKEYSGKAIVNVLPITYRPGEKCKEHAFYHVIAKEHTDSFFSRVSKPERVVRALPPVRPATQKKRVKRVKTDGVEPTGEPSGFIPVEDVETIEGVEPDGEAKPERSVQQAEGVKSDQKLKSVGAIVTNQDADASSSEDLSESRLGNESNEADISDISGSIGISGDLQIRRGSN